MSYEDKHLAQLIAAAELVIREQFGAASFVQRTLRVGFAQATWLLDELEKFGVVGPPHGSRARDLLVGPDQVEAVVTRIGQGRES